MGVLGGIVCLIIGSYFLYDTIKNPIEDYEPLSLKGYVSGIGFILGGVLLILEYFGVINWG